MPTRVRRALLAAAAPVLLVAPAAGAVCAAQVCVDVPSPGEAVRAITTTLDGGGGLPGDGDGDGVLCLYVKLSGPPPAGWGGAPDSKPPYVWQQTQKWGNEHPREYDTRACIPGCAVAPDVAPGPCPRAD